MNKQTIPSEVLDAAKSPDWRAVPHAISTFRKEGGAVAGTAFWDALGKACGCHAHALRQRCTAFDLVTRNANVLGEKGVQAAWSRSYTQLELIARIDKVDHIAALRLLGDAQRDATVAALRRRLAEVRTTAGASSGLVQGHKALGTAKGLVARFLESTSPKVDGEVRFVPWAGGGAYVSPSMVAARTLQGRAFTQAVVVTAKDDRISASKILAKAGFESTFFDIYWIAVPESAYRDALHEGISILDLRNVGLLVFDADKARASIVRGPTNAVPSPDRRPLLDLAPYYFT